METTEKVHAELSPSGADGWMTCLGKTAQCKGLPNISSKYSDEGTDYHTLAAICVDEGKDPQEFVGRELPLGTIVTEEGAKFLKEGYLDPLKQYAADGTLEVEKAVSLAWYTGNPDDEGTADAIILRPDRELIVDDLKFGMGVEVDPDDNRQCKIYALSYIKQNQLEDEYDTIRLVISQPRTGDGKPKEWTTSMASLLAFGEEVKKTAAKILYAEKKGIELPLVPSEKACKFCKARATCPALSGLVTEALAEGFENIEEKTFGGVGGVSLTRAEVLGRMMDRINLIEIHMKGVQSVVEIELLAGKPVLGQDGPYKLVQGKKGNRKWINKDDAEKLLQSFRLKKEQIYNMTLISPTDAEELLKKDMPGRWEKVKKMYDQAEGGKHVANALDKRPAISVEKPEEGFTEVTSGAEEFF
jgi:hypothetical protein